MRKKNKNAEKSPTITPQENERDKFFRLFNEYLQSELHGHSLGTTSGPAPSPTAIPTLADNYENLDDPTKKAIDKFMEEIEPDIQKKATELLRNEIRDKIARTGNINKLLDMAKKGKKVEIKRKKGCIFLQMGSGDPADEIEEFLVAST